MSDELKALNEMSSNFKKISSKIKLYTLISKAKKEYDSYNFSEAKQNLEQAKLVDSKNSTVLRGLGCLELFNKNYKGALDYFNKALKNSSEKELELTLIGMVYYLQDKLDDSIKYFNLAISENENYDKAYEARNQAMLENHLKIIDLQEALKKYF